MPQVSPDQAGVLMKVLAALIGAVLLVDLGLIGAWAVRLPAVRQGRARPLFARQWSLVDVWFALQAVLFAVNALGLVVLLFIVLAHAFTGDLQTALNRWMLPVVLASLVPQNVLFVALPVWFITRRYGVRLPAIGFTLRPRPAYLVLGFVFGLGAMVVGWASEQLVVAAMRAALGHAAFASIERANELVGNEKLILTALRAPGWFWVLLIGAGVLAPVGEEFFFRGFLYNAARRRFGVRAAIVISAVAFGVVHGGPLLALAIVPVGVLLALAYERTGSLWVPIVMHATNNSVQLLAARYLHIGT